MRAMKNTLLVLLLVVVVGASGWYVTSLNASSNVAAAPAAQQTADAYAALPTPTEPAPSSEASPSVAPAPAATTPAEEQKKITGAIFHTNKGDFSVVFFDGDAPNTVANFIKLAKSGFYDGTKFHRVIQGFMIQGGDPFSKDDTKKEYWGRGGPGYTFADEIGPNNHNVAGSIAMANSGPNTNGSQFFVNVNNNTSLDPKHTVFGKVVDGVDVVLAIAGTPTGEADRPVDPVVITSITLR